MKLLRWMLSTIVMVPFGALGGWLLGVLIHPAAWYTQVLAVVLLLVTLCLWVWTTYRINRYLQEQGW